MQGNSWRGGRVWIERCGEGIGVASAGASATDCSRGRKGQDWTGLDRMDLSFSYQNDLIVPAGHPNSRAQYLTGRKKGYKEYFIN